MNRSLSIDKWLWKGLCCLFATSWYLKCIYSKQTEGVNALIYDISDAIRTKYTNIRTKYTNIHIAKMFDSCGMYEGKSLVFNGSWMTSGNLSFKKKKYGNAACRWWDWEEIRMNVERTSLCNCVVNFLLEENYILTAFELLHELLDDGRHDQAIRLQQYFSDPSRFPPNQISRFNSLPCLLLLFPLFQFLFHSPFFQTQFAFSFSFPFYSGRSSNSASTQRRSGRKVSHHWLRTTFGTRRHFKTQSSIAIQNWMPQSTKQYIAISDLLNLLRI